MITIYYPENTYFHEKEFTEQLETELQFANANLVLERVQKISGKPFKSTLKINTVKKVNFVKNPNKKMQDTVIPALFFFEDNSFVSLTRCELIK